MAAEHEYALLGGRNRSVVGRWIGAIAGAISGAIVFLLLSVVDLAGMLGWNVNVPPAVLSLFGAGAVYTVLYLLFDKHWWKIGPVAKSLGVVNLSGDWLCQGVPVGGDNKTPWSGRMTIIQSWDRIQVHLDAGTSTSDSIAAALQHDKAAGYRLIYHYQNQPRLSDVGLAAHHGFAELIFTPDLKTAKGEYFNGRGRNTFGTMNLEKE